MASLDVAASANAGVGDAIDDSRAKSSCRHPRARET